MAPGDADHAAAADEAEDDVDDVGIRYLIVITNPAIGDGEVEQVMTANTLREAAELTQLNAGHLLRRLRANDGTYYCFNPHGAHVYIHRREDKDAEDDPLQLRANPPQDD